MGEAHIEEDAASRLQGVETQWSGARTLGTLTK